MGIWVLIILSLHTGRELLAQGTTATVPTVTTQEFQSRDRCLKAADFILKQSRKDAELKAMCVQK